MTEQQAFERLIQIMMSLGIATGHADGWADLLDSLEVELRETLSFYRNKLERATA